MDDAIAWWDCLEDGFRCRKHPSWRRNGACAYCLRDRLLRLCPDCAHTQPCTCSAPSSFSASSSSSSCSSSDYALRLPPPQHRGVGAVGRVSQLIETEPAFQRSRSAAFSFLRGADRYAAPPPKKGFWPLTMLGAEWKKENQTTASEARFSRLRSVNVERLPATARSRIDGDRRGEEKAKGWRWHIPSPMKVFIKHRKSSTVVQEQS